MTLAFEPQPIPLESSLYGTIRVGKTRVRLETVVFAFNQGQTAEEIVVDFPALQLADVYVVIAYYLNNRELIDTYIQKQNMQANRLKEQIEQKPEYQAFRQRLLARQKR